MTFQQIQNSFNAGELAPTLYARTDLKKYGSAAALLENFYVDYRGGASSRMGTKYLLQAYKSSTAVRLIGFQASVDVGYILEFGDFYIRFYNNGAPILETAINITGASQANPCVISVPGNAYSANDWIYVIGITGMTQLNGRYFSITNVAGNDLTLADLNGAAINSTAYTAYIADGTAARVYTIPSPYAAADLAKVKFAQNVDRLILTHPSYSAQVLTFVSSTSWTLVPITYGTTMATPGGVLVATTLAAGTVNYSYIVTAVDANGQESGQSTPASLVNKTDLRTVAGTNRITWNAISGAQSYNVYKAEPSYTNVVAAGAQYGFIGNCTGVTFDDSNIESDFSQTPPIAQNPFLGAGVDSITVTAPGVYTTVPTVTIAAPTSGATATASVILQVQGTPTDAGGGSNNWTVGDISFFTASSGAPSVAIVAATVDGGGNVLTWQPITFPGSNPGAISLGATPANPVIGSGPNGGTGSSRVNFVWGVGVITPINHGSGYTTVPAVTFSAGAAAATAILGSASAGNPSVPTFFQQRLVLAAQTNSPQSYFMSQPGAYYNFDTTSPSQADDGIFETLVASQLNTIRAMVSQPSGLLMMSNSSSWLINGGAQGAPVDGAGNLVANAHSFNGISDVPPIVANFDILYVQEKGSIVRDLSYNFYANVFTGTDISVLSSHLFYGYTVTEWAWAEEPFKIAWAIRSDGTLLSLTFLKEQEFCGWSHSVTGPDQDAPDSFKSVASVTENTDTAGKIDAVYFVVERLINGNTVKYIERLAERIFPNGVTDAWCVDAGLQYDGSPATSFSGGEHLAGATVTGLADGEVITPFVMAANGSFTLTAAASKVTVGLAFTPKLTTLPIDMGEPTVQGRQKAPKAVILKVADTLGLKGGSDYSNLVVMKDLRVGNVGSQTNTLVTDLVTGDVQIVLDPKYSEQGQYCFQQDVPMPVTILGLIPNFALGDGPNDRKNR